MIEHAHSLKKKRHDINEALVRLSGLLDLAESGYDFSEPKGSILIKAARQAVGLLQESVRANFNDGADEKATEGQPEATG